MIQNQIVNAFSLQGLDLFAFNSLAKEWNLDFLQLGSGKFEGALSQIIHNEYQLGYALFNTRIKQEGFSPPGVWTFAFVNNTPIHWRNYAVEPNSIIIYAPGSKINAVSSAGFEVYTFSISVSRLNFLAMNHGYEAFVKSLEKKELLKSEPIEWQNIRSQIAAYMHDALSQGKDIEISLSDFDALTISILQLMNESTLSSNMVSSKSRLEILQDAEEMMNTNSEGIKIVEIAERLSVSERTLLYSFKKRYGIGPKQFMKILNLNRVYMQLRTEDASIGSIARQNGFWHLGQFDKDYKKLFAEVPTVTVGKSSVELS